MRTFAAWSKALRAAATTAEALVGPDLYRSFTRYFAASIALFRLRQQALYRIVLERRPEPKRWVVPPGPVPLAAGERASGPARGGPHVASAAAVRSHYDVSNEMYRLWLGPTMSYSSGAWSALGPRRDLEGAQAAKVELFAGELDVAGARVLDVGCGWGYQLRPMVDRHGAAAAVGLTLSAAQARWLSERPIRRAEVRVESWTDHDPAATYDVIMSFGAFEHFARDGSTTDERVAGYRAFFGRCFGWLPAGGRLGLETIAHDDAPDTSAPLGRGPLGDFVLEQYPESLPPHLCEVVQGFEPYFAVRLLRSDAPDFARTAHAWLAGLVAHEDDVVALAGRETFRRFKTYLASSEVQFRMRTITNYRIVLERRPAPRR